MKKSYGASIGEEIHVDCSVLSHEPDLRFEWSFNNTQEVIYLAEDKFSDSGGGKSTLRYTPRDENQYGNLLCRAENSVGLQIHPCLFVVYKAGKEVEI